MELTVCLHGSDLMDWARWEATVLALGGRILPWTGTAPSALPEGEVLCLVDLLAPDALHVARAAASLGYRVLAYGPHVRSDLFRAAAEEGVEACARSAVQKRLMGHARLPHDLA